MPDGDVMQNGSALEDREQAVAAFVASELGFEAMGYLVGVGGGPESERWANQMRTFP
jgi:hypothetical protein